MRQANGAEFPDSSAFPGAGGWPAVPPQVADVMRPELGRAAEEVIVAIQRDVPEYARPDDDIYTSTVRRAVHQAVRQFVLQIADPGTSREATAQLFRDIGRIEAAEGRSLEPLQAALRLGARVTWRMLCEQAVRGSLSIDVIGPVGEALFLYLAEPGGRFELEVALRARGLLRARPVPPQPALPGRPPPGRPPPGRHPAGGHPQEGQPQGGA